MALSLADVEESTSYGTSAPKVKGALMVRLKEVRLKEVRLKEVRLKEDGESLVVRTDFEQR